MSIDKYIRYYESDHPKGMFYQNIPELFTFTPEELDRVGYFNDFKLFLAYENRGIPLITMMDNPWLMRWALQNHLIDTDVKNLAGLACHGAWRSLKVVFEELSFREHEHKEWLKIAEIYPYPEIIQGLVDQNFNLKPYHRWIRLMNNEEMLRIYLRRYPKMWSWHEMLMCFEKQNWVRLDTLIRTAPGKYTPCGMYMFMCETKLNLGDQARDIVKLMMEYNFPMCGREENFVRFRFPELF